MTDRVADASQRLNTDVMHSILDTLALVDVLRFAHICRRWRSIALTHTNYYQPIHLRDLDNASIALFITALRDAQKNSRRIALTFDVPEILPGELAVLERDAFPAMTAALGLVKKLAITFSDEYELLLYDALARPAPQLEQLHLMLVDAEMCDEPSIREGVAALRGDVFGGCAPRLRTLNLSGVPLAPQPLPAFSRVRTASLDYTHRARTLPLAELFPLLRALELSWGTTDGDDSSGRVPSLSVNLPASLARVNIRQRGPERLVCPGLERVRDVGMWLAADYEFESAEMDYSYFFRPLETASALALHVFYDAEHNAGDFAFASAEEPPSGMRIAFADAARGLARTFYPDAELYDVDADPDDAWGVPYPGLEFLRDVGRALTSVSVDHEFLAFLFETFDRLPALTTLDVHLDRLRGAPFWSTEAMYEHDDDWSSDKSTAGGRTTSPHPADEDETASDLINTFDPDERRLACPALRTVALRASYVGTGVHTRQLAHFGRALAAARPPRLVLCGVQLTHARRGRLHETVFRPIVHETPAVPLKQREPRPRRSYGGSEDRFVGYWDGDYNDY